MLALWNRELHWPEGRVETALILVVLARPRSSQASRSSAAAAEPRSPPSRSSRVFVLSWNLTNEIYAAYGEYDLSERMSRNFTQPHDWVDRAVGDGSVTLVGQQFGTDHERHPPARVLEPVDRQRLERRPDEPRAGARGDADA